MTTPSEKHLRILVISNPLDHEGGVANFVRQLFTHMETGSIVAAHHPLGSRMKYFYAPVQKRLLYPILYIWDLARLFVRIAEDRDIRILHVNPSLIPVPLVRDGMAILLARMLRRRTVVMFHGWSDRFFDLILKYPLARSLMRGAYARCDVVIVLGNAFKEKLISLGFDEKKIHVLTTMYDKRDVLAPAARTDEIIRFLYLGRVSRLKGIDDLIEAASLLRRQCNGFHVVVAGHEGRQGVLETYRSRVAGKGLSDSFTFPGRLEGKDKSRAYAEADVYVLPSWSEGCPTTVLEALGNGLFVVATNVGALPDIIEDRNNGILVPPRNPEALAEALTWTHDHIDTIRARRQFIREEAEKHFEAEAVCSDLKLIYEFLIEGQ